MAVRWYIMPAEPIGGRFMSIRSPKHLETIGSSHWSWLVVHEDWGIGWIDTDEKTHEAYADLPGVKLLTEDLSIPVGDSVNAVREILDEHEMPSAWLRPDWLWGPTIKRILAYVTCVQRYWGESRESLCVGRPRTTSIGSLTVTVRSRLAAVAMNLDLPVPESQDTVETMMNRWADELVLRPIYVGGVLF